jgi:hypothetical protein
MSTYKQRLLNALITDDWELVEINDQSQHWWCDEYWRIRSVQENWGLELLIIFLVDPQWDAPRKKGQGIWAISANTNFPEGWGEASREIALLSLTKRKFDSKLYEFVLTLKEYRRKVQSKDQIKLERRHHCPRSFARVSIHWQKLWLVFDLSLFAGLPG